MLYLLVQSVLCWLVTLYLFLNLPSVKDAKMQFFVDSCKKSMARSNKYTDLEMGKIKFLAQQRIFYIYQLRSVFNFG